MTSPLQITDVTERAAKRQIWAAVDLLMQKFDTDGSDTLDKNECQAPLAGLHAGLGKDFNDEILKSYFADEQYVTDEDAGIGREGLFRLICEINNLEVPDNIFVTTMPTE